MLRLSTPTVPPLRPMLRASDLPTPQRTAWFLDLDGTLLDIAPTPDAVICPPDLRASLANLVARTGGAVAVITGRQRAFVAALLQLPDVPIIGLHGAEMPGRPLPVPPPGARARMEAFAARHPGVLVEDKGAGLGLHYRLAPEARAGVEAVMAEVLAEAGPAFRLRPGHAVVELCPASGDKGAALVALMATPPFEGRIPFAAGDDLTDEGMLREASHRGGLSLRIGPADTPSVAGFALADAAAFRSFLAEITA